MVSGFLSFLHEKSLLLLLLFPSIFNPFSYLGLVTWILWVHQLSICARSDSIQQYPFLSYKIYNPLTFWFVQNGNGPWEVVHWWDFMGHQ
ncbi:hypothetical protein L6452_31314 [Arctium lappa]|uniref:Uncharacterized protein n=1 Tax=Arctium lappa TaxID=4217 RepID=A0ACB8ZKX7_ARCLA|nr:hypothetical protein L6452_31314 [Arctium lappa]